MPSSDSKAPHNQRFKYIYAAISILFAFAAYVFWAFPYRAALSYREQMQLFLTTPSYLSGFTSWPGGPVACIGEFLTQFFNNYYIGAAILALVLTAIQVSACHLCRKAAPAASRPLVFVLSFLPAISLWLCLGNPNITLAFALALLCAMWGCNRKPYVSVITLSLLYWIAGPAAIITAAITIIRVLTSGAKHKIAGVAAVIVTVAANIYAWSLICTSPLYCQLCGMGYMLTPGSLMTVQAVTMILCVAAPLLALVLAKAPARIATAATAVAGAAGVAIAWPHCYDPVTWQLINYDYYVRANDWQGLLDYADTHAPTLPLSVSATNLALGMTGQLDSRAFNYYQNGPEGLVPTFTKETISSWVTGEILFQLGMVNDARRFYFEGMEAIPDYAKSPRALRRMAECAMVNGDTKVAEKYLNNLSHTIFYSKWAKRALDMLHTPGAIDKHPLYSRLRKSMPDDDYMYSDGEIDKSIGQIFLKNPANSLARQYLVVYPLLQRDLDKFMQYMQVVSESTPGYSPLLAQQAVAFYFVNKGQTPPAGVVPQPVVEQLRSFARAYSTHDTQALGRFSNSLYSYLMQTAD